ncbi:hypothetical protein [Haloferula sp.]|uniref:hypothetical protein n=1 Tax=Haloferula sp. TaxID=2497595 RepID=UPI003C78CFB3
MSSQLLLLFVLVFTLAATSQAGARNRSILGDDLMVRASGNVELYRWDGSTATRTNVFTNCEQFTADQAQAFYLKSNQVKVSVAHGTAVNFHSSTQAVSDLILSDRDLLLARPGAAFAILDRFDGRELGTLPEPADSGAWIWDHRVDEGVLAGFRSGAASWEVCVISLRGDRSPSYWSMPRLRQAASGDAMWICRGGRRAWFSDGSLRDLATGEVRIDAGTSINAADSISLGIHAIAVGDTIRFLDHEGNLIEEFSHSSEFTALASSGHTVTCVDARRQGLVIVLTDEPLRNPPVILPPEPYNPYSFGHVQGLADGRLVLSGPASRQAHVFDPSLGDFHFSIQLPSRGRVHAFDSINRIGFAPENRAEPPSFADFNPRASWSVGAAAPHNYTHILHRAATDTAWMLSLDSVNDFQIGWNALNGEIVEAPLQGDITTDGAWDDVSRTLHAMEGTRTIKKFVATDGGGIEMVSSVFEGLVSDGNPTFVSVAPGGDLVATAESVWGQDPGRRIARFENRVAAAVWTDDKQLVTLRAGSGNTTILEVRPGPYYWASERKQFPGRPVALHRHGSGLTVVVQDEGKPWFISLDSSLKPDPRTVLPPMDPAGISLTAKERTSLTFSIGAGLTSNDAIIAEYRRTSSIEKPWIPHSCHPGDAALIEIDGLVSGWQYQVRFTGIRGGFRSPASNLETHTTTKSIGALDGNPFRLNASWTPGSGVQLHWDDLLSEETGFRITRRNTVSNETLTFDVAADSTAFIDASAAGGTEYEYTILARRGNFSGTASPPTAVSTRDPGSTMSSHIDFEFVDFGLVGISWRSLVNNGAFEVALEKRGSISSEWQRLGVFGSDVSHYLDISAQLEGRSQYRLVLLKSSGPEAEQESEWLSHVSWAWKGNEVAKRYGDVVYLRDPGRNLVRRYSLSEKAWLPDLKLQLPEACPNFFVSPLGLFFGNDRGIFHHPAGPGTTSRLELGPGVSQVRAFWTSGNRLHFATQTYPAGIHSLRFEEGEVHGPAITSPMTSMPIGPVFLSEDSRQVYNKQAGSFGNLVRLDEWAPGRFEVSEVATPPSSGASRFVPIPDSDYVMDDHGWRMKRQQLDSPIRVNLGWHLFGLSDSGHFLLQQSRRIYLQNHFLSYQGNVSMQPGESFAAGGREYLHLFRFDRNDDSVWKERSVELSTLGFEPIEKTIPTSLPDWFWSTPSGVRWHQPRDSKKLITTTSNAMIPLTGYYLQHAISADQRRAAVLVVMESGRLEVNLIDGESSQVLAAIPVNPDSHSVSWEDSLVRVISPATSTTYDLGGNPLTNTPGAIFPSIMASLPAPQDSVSFTRTEGNKAVISFSGTDFSEEVTLDSAASRLQLCVAPELDRLFTWPGGLRSIFELSETIHLNCISPVDVCFACDRLIILDEAGPVNWVIAYDASSGQELQRRRLSHQVRSLDPVTTGFEMTEVGLSHGVALWKTNAELAPAPDTHSFPPAAIIPISSSEGVEGDDLVVYPQYSGSGPFSSQWYKDGIPLPSQVSLNLELPEAEPSDNGSYHLVITGPGGSIQTSPHQVVIHPLAAESEQKFLARKGFSLIEFGRDGQISKTIPIPQSYWEQPRSFWKDGTGRYVVTYGFNFSEVDYILVSESNGGWKKLEVPSFGDGNTSNLMIHRNSMRIGQFDYDLPSQRLRRSEFRALRSFGQYLVTKRGIEDWDFNLIVAIPVGNIPLENGYAVPSIYSNYGYGDPSLDGVFSLTSIEDLSTFLVKVPATYYRFSPALSPFTHDELLFISQDTILLYNIATNEWTNIPVPSGMTYWEARDIAPLHRPDVTFDLSSLSRSAPELAYFLNVGWIARNRSSAVHEIQEFGRTSSLKPTDPSDHSDLLVWDDFFLPIEKTWHNWRTPQIWNGIRYYGMDVALSSQTNLPISKLLFSTDLRNWSEEPPPGVEVRVVSSSPAFRIEMPADSAELPRFFFKLESPPLPAN